MITAPSYLGRWILIPELCMYETGTPPVSAAYCIDRAEDGSLALHLSWRASADAEQQNISFRGPPDGTPQPLDASHDGGPDSFSLTHVDDATLVSTAMVAGRVVAYARRVVSADQSLLAVVQEFASETGPRVRDFQVYRRADS